MTRPDYKVPAEVSGADSPSDQMIGENADPPSFCQPSRELAAFLELRHRFGLRRSSDIARALRISVKEAQRLLRRAKVEERQ